MFKNRLSRRSKQRNENQWMLEGVDAEESKELKTRYTFASADSNSEEESDDDSVDLMAEKKIYSNDHKHHPDLESDFRWSIKPDTRLSIGNYTMKVKLGALEESNFDNSDTNCYLSSDEEDFGLGSEPMVTGEDKTQMLRVLEERSLDSDDNCYQTSDDDDFELDLEPVVTRDKNMEKVVLQKDGNPMVVTDKDAPKKTKKKKKKVVALVDSTRSIGSGSSKGKKKVKKKQERDGEESQELTVARPKTRKKKNKVLSREEPIGASNEMIGNRTGVLSGGILDKSNPLVPSEIDREKDEADEYPSSEDRAGKLAASAEGGGPGGPKDSMTPLERFRAAGTRVCAIQKVHSCAADSKFSAAFHSHADESVNAGLMSESDKAITVEKLLAELQQYEAQLYEERNKLAEERELLMLQQKSVEHLLASESRKTQGLEVRVLELENILEHEIHQQETEELVMKVQQLESELERREEVLFKMAAEHQTELKRQNSRDLIIVASDESSDHSEIEEDPQETLTSSIRSIPNAKLQGEILQLRSSLNHKDIALAEQAKEIAMLRELLQKSEKFEHAQKLIQVEASREDFRNEKKQFRSEILELKNQLEEVEAALHADVVTVKKLGKADEEKSETFKQAKEDEKKAISKLECHLIMNLTHAKPREITINNVLDIGAPSQLPMHTEPTSADDAMVEEAGETQTEMVGEELKNNWFRFGNGKKEQTNQNERKEEKTNWFGFGDKEDEKKKKEEEGGGWFNRKEEEGSGWFGFGKKGERDEFDQLLDA